MPYQSAKKSRNIPKEKAQEISELSNHNLVERCSQEYESWKESEKQKKLDGQIERIRDQIKALEEEEIKSDLRYQELERDLKVRKEELTTEEIATLKSELKNIVEPYSEDIRYFKGLFEFAMGEIKSRRNSGII